MNLKIGFYVFALPILAACTLNPPAISKQWSSNMREMGIHPIFPPRADVRVGDVYAMPYCDITENSGHYDPIGVRISSLEPFIFNASGPVSKTLSEQEASRAKFPDLTDRDITTSASSYISAIRFGSASGYSVNLHQVALPGFINAEASGSGISALLTAHSLPIPVSANFSDKARASINIPRAESYSFPATKLYEHYTAASGSIVPRYFFNESEKNKKEACDKKILITIMSEVYYARQFDVILNQEATSALALTYKDEEEKFLKELKSRIPSPPQVASGTNQDAEAAKEKSIANAIGALLTSKGGSEYIGKAWNQGIKLTNSYQEPIAIGYRGITIILDENGKNSMTDGSTSEHIFPTETECPPGKC